MDIFSPFSFDTCGPKKGRCCHVRAYHSIFVHYGANMKDTKIHYKSVHFILICIQRTKPVWFPSYSPHLWRLQTVTILARFCRSCFGSRHNIKSRGFVFAIEQGRVGKSMLRIFLTCQPFSQCRWCTLVASSCSVVKRRRTRRKPGAPDPSHNEDVIHGFEQVTPSKYAPLLPRCKKRRKKTGKLFRKQNPGTAEKAYWLSARRKGLSGLAWYVRSAFTGIQWGY